MFQLTIDLMSRIQTQDPSRIQESRPFKLPTAPPFLGRTTKFQISKMGGCKKNNFE